MNNDTGFTLPTEVLEGLQAVRDSGLVNMFGKKDVASVAEELGFEATADWARAARGGEYIAGLNEMARFARDNNED